jgi:hypothetical protein
MTAGLDETALASEVFRGKWSLKEIVCHLWRVQEVFEGRIEAMLTRDHPTIEPYDPDKDLGFAERIPLPASELIEGFLAERDQFVTLLDSLNPSDWHRSGRHPEFKEFDVHFQVEYMANHEAHHIYQLFQRRVPLGKLPHAS